jgi:large subunit ribosomal protein L6
MSRIGKHPVEIPSGVQVTFAGNLLTAKGKLGELKATVSEDVSVVVESSQVVVSMVEGNKRSKQQWGATRTQVSNLVVGVSAGFTKELEINGVGYKAAVQGKEIVLSLGFSHEIRYPIPAGVEVKCEKPTAISIKGADKQQIGQMAAEIRAFRPPEPYKGKGVKYAGEEILRKEGKKK